MLIKCTWIFNYNFFVKVLLILVQYFFIKLNQNNFFYSNSIVAGGLDVQSSSTLLTPATSFTILLEILSKTS